MSQDQINQVEVRISTIEIANMGGSFNAEATIVYRLRAAGIPVRGLMLFSGVERGKLEIFDEANPPARVFRWVGDVAA